MTTLVFEYATTLDAARAAVRELLRDDVDERDWSGEARLPRWTDCFARDAGGWAGRVEVDTADQLVVHRDGAAACGTETFALWGVTTGRRCELHYVLSVRVNGLCGSMLAARAWWRLRAHARAHRAAVERRCAGAGAGAVF